MGHNLALNMYEYTCITTAMFGVKKKVLGFQQGCNKLINGQ